MKLLFDFFPILLFFVTFKLYDDPGEGILAATAVIIVATCLQVLITWVRHRSVEKMHLITLGIMVVLGGITLFLQDEIYVKWKPTVVNWLFAAGFLASQFIGKKTLVERMMGAQLQLPPPVWTRLNISWVVFFIVCGVLNLYVVYHFDTDTWVNFKLFGLMGLTFLFLIGQGLFLVRYWRDDETGKTGES